MAKKNLVKVRIEFDGEIFVYEVPSIVAAVETTEGCQIVVLGRTTEIHLMEMGMAIQEGILESLDKKMDELSDCDGNCEDCIERVK